MRDLRWERWRAKEGPLKRNNKDNLFYAPLKKILTSRLGVTGTRTVKPASVVILKVFEGDLEGVRDIFSKSTNAVPLAGDPCDTALEGVGGASVVATFVGEAMESSECRRTGEFTLRESPRILGRLSMLLGCSKDRDGERFR